jgi:biotin synthase
MSDELQALCFVAGANAIFYGEKLLTTGNPDVDADRQLFARLGIHALQIDAVESARPTRTVHAGIVEAAALHGAETADA